jgi:hypothetical protein
MRLNVQCAATALVVASGIAAAQDCTGAPQALVYPSNIGISTDYFGQSVAVDNTRAVVAAPYDNDLAGDSGAVYVYDRAGSNWSLTQKIKAPTADANGSDWFGSDGRRGVDIAGNYLIVGAPRDDETAPDAGAAYIYLRDTATNTWNFQAKIRASDGAQSDYFGYSVAIEGSTVVIGAYLEDTIANDQGAAYVYRRTGTNWNFVAKLTANDPAASDQFGIDVDISGTFVAIGAYLDDDRGGDSGSAYIFNEIAPGNFQQQAKVTASDGAGSDHFGLSVSIAGDSLVVGARLNDDFGTDSGSAYAFRRLVGTFWVEEAKLQAGDIGTGDEFGNSVRLVGNRAIIGSRYDDDRGGESGGAYFFERDANGIWSVLGKFTATQIDNNDWYGDSVGFDGTRVIVGAPRNDQGSPTNTGWDNGAASIFTIDCSSSNGCAADLTGDGQIDSGDLQLFIQLFLAGTC